MRKLPALVSTYFCKNSFGRQNIYSEKTIHIYNLEWMQNCDVEEEKSPVYFTKYPGPIHFRCSYGINFEQSLFYSITSNITLLAQSFVRAIRLYRHLWYLNSCLWNFLELRKTTWYVKLINLNLLKSFIGENKSYIVGREIYDGKL